MLFKQKYIYTIGYLDSMQTNADVLLIKTDTAGNEIWKKKIGLPNIDEYGYSIDTLQQDLVISGNKTPHNTNNSVGFVMRIDTSGNVVWQKTVATNGGYIVAFCKTLKDGNILIYTWYKVYTIGADDYLKLQVEKITPNNTVLWLKRYDEPAINIEGHSVIENKQGNIIIAGQKAFNINQVNGFVNVINQNGDSLFYKEFYTIQGCQNYFRDVVQAPDDGYCFAGYFIPVYANSQCTGTQDIWLLKVDSNFCESAVPCNANVGISEAEALEASDKWVRMYPNPAHSILTIETDEEIKSITVYNSLGAVVWLLSQTATTLKSIDVSGFSSGVYYIELKLSNGILRKKFVRE